MPRNHHPLSREKLRDLRSLESVKTRRRKGLCIVEGERSLGEACRAGKLVYLVIPRGTAAEDPHARKLCGPDVPCYTVAEEHFREISGVKSGPGILGAARIPEGPSAGTIPDVQVPSLYFLLDGVQEPGNVGALIRTAWGLGASGALLARGTADPFGRRAVRASAGGVFHLPLFEGVGPVKMRNWTDGGYTLFAAVRDGQDYRAVTYPERSILALGNEGAGFSDWVLQNASPVGIPLAGGVDSLNVVVAGGIIASRMIG